MNKILSIIGLAVCLALNAKAQSVYSTNLATGTNLIVSSAVQVTSITLLSATANTIKFYDANSVALTYSNNTYITRGNYVTNNLPVIHTNSLGIVNTNYYSGIFTYFTTNSAATNKLPQIASISLQAGIPISLPVNLLVVQGLAAEGTNTATFSMTYGPLTP